MLHTEGKISLKVSDGANINQPRLSMVFSDMKGSKCKFRCLFSD